MATTTIPRRQSADLELRPKRRWPAAYYLAFVGVFFLCFEVWVLGGWLADGPRAVTEFRDSHTVDWWAARVYETLAVLFALGMLVHLVRACRRERRFIWDAKFVVATGLLYWVDPFVNTLQPIFFYSSNWVNLENWCGHSPFAVNPDCGRLPEPILFLLPLYSFGFLGFTMALNKGMGWARDRWPGMSKLQLVAATFVAGMFLDILLEGPIVLFKLWIYPGWPLSFTGGGLHRFPFFELIIASILWTGLACVRFFRDDQGRTIVDRGTESLRPRIRGMVAFLGIVGAANLCAFASNTILMVHGPFMERYGNMPDWNRNEMCDSGSYRGTAYGPCPGQPGYRIPVKKTSGR